MAKREESTHDWNEEDATSNPTQSGQNAHQEGQDKESQGPNPPSGNCSLSNSLRTLCREGAHRDRLEDEGEAEEDSDGAWGNAHGNS